MSTRILLRNQPHRALALTTGSHALILRHSSFSSENPQSTSTQTFSDGTARCIVEFSRLEAVDLSDYRQLSVLPIQGVLGLITIDEGVFLCVVSASTRVATVRRGENVQKIDAVEFHCLNSADYDNLLAHEVNPFPTDILSEDGFEHDYGHDRREHMEHPCLALKKLLSGGSFYYSEDFDLTNRLQDRSTYNVSLGFDTFDEEFLWNSYMIKPLVNFRARLATAEREALDASGLLKPAIRGFALSIVIPAASSPIHPSQSGLPSTLTLISRLSCRRAGTRFNARGIDDDGNVANFVETETILYAPSGVCFSFTQVRGSVPIFWEQAAGLLPGQQKIQITRSKEATQPAFDKHFEELNRNYGAVHILNLLSETKPGELELTDRYRYHVRHNPLNDPREKGDTSHQLLRETEFDFHARTKGPSGYEAASAIKHFVEASIDGFAYYLAEDSPEPSAGDVSSSRKPAVVLQQEGIFRTNCLDCLDRTNLIQTIVSQVAIEAFLHHRNERATPDFWMRHSTVWADNGDSLSRIYAGTGALKTSFTRHGKMSLAGAIADARKSAARMYINNFADKGRQTTMDLLLGRLMGQAPVHLYDPINDFVSYELNRRASEYSSSHTVSMWVGTFNVNGRTPGIDDDLSSWLCPASGSNVDPDIVVVGFQEIVELNPQQIMSTDPSVRQGWERLVKETLDDRARSRGSAEYALVRSGQLVGAALMIFVKATALKNIKNVEGSVKKTGMSGMAGNKGAVAIRMEYSSTKICFVTAHLAAGFANYEERNKDYNTISQGLRFQRNYSIQDHDTIIWLGDFNYRIGLGDETVRRLIHEGDIATMYDNDQLNLQMVAGLTFPFYSEARITFMPTYRFDIGVDVYDTSEKHRIPAWCDRILWKGNNLRQLAYKSAPLRFSDHRPVYAQFRWTTAVVDEALKEQLTREIYEQRREEVGHATASKETNDTDDDEDLIGYDPIAPELPPASSDRRKWWLDNGLPVRSSVEPPKQGQVPNPRRPSNPFTPTSELDWVASSAIASAMTTPKHDGTSHPSDGTPTRRALPPPFKAPGSSNTPGSLATTRSDSPRIHTTNPQQPAQQPQAPTRSAAKARTDILRKPAPPPPVPKKPINLSDQIRKLSLQNEGATSVSASPVVGPTKPRTTVPPSQQQRQRPVHGPTDSVATPTMNPASHTAPPSSTQNRSVAVRRDYPNNDNNDSGYEDDPPAPLPLQPPRGGRITNGASRALPSSSSPSADPFEQNEAEMGRLTAWKSLSPR